MISMPKSGGGSAVMRRGVLMHVSSLPSEYGVGGFGAEAYRFAEMLAGCGADLWAMLPLGATSHGDSPYQSFSSFALNPYFLDLDELISQGLLTKEECSGVCWGGDPAKCDYGALYENRLPLLTTAYARAIQREGFAEELAAFADERPYIREYALFMAIKDMMGGAPWYEWPEGLKRREPSAMEDILPKIEHEYNIYIFIQKELFRQWAGLRAHCRGLGVSLMGDMPIYCAYDSADCWAHPGCFMLDGELAPVDVAGVPPDYFSPLGQKWGNPLYDWKALKKNGYGFWLDRMRAAAELYDVLRIDHFRGFAGYYAIPADMPDARVGEWRKGCGYGLFAEFAAMQRRGDAPPCEIVAEDLGFITPDVKRLLTKTGFAGMQVAEFAFGGGRDNPHRNKRWDGDPASLRNKICYTGTHDNPPLAEWWLTIGREERRRALLYAGLTMKKDRQKVLNLIGDNGCLGCPDEKKELCKYRPAIEKRAGQLAAYYLTEAVVRCNARIAVVPMQDVLCLGEGSRMNTPGTSEGNWQWRLDKSLLPQAADRMRELFGGKR